jgi:hypothetical protein
MLNCSENKNNQRSYHVYFYVLLWITSKDLFFHSVRGVGFPYRECWGYLCSILCLNRCPTCGGNFPQCGSKMADMSAGIPSMCEAPAHKLCHGKICYMTAKFSGK